MVVMILTAVHNGQRQLTMDHVSQKTVFSSIRLRIKRKETMANVCSVYKCYSNKAGHPTKAAFKIPKDLELRKSRLKLLNRKYRSEDMKYIYICELNFEEKNISRNENRVRLINAMNPVPTKCPNSIENKSLLPNLITPRKPPAVRTFQNDKQKLDAYKKLFLN